MRDHIMRVVMICVLFSILWGGIIGVMNLRPPLWISLLIGIPIGQFAFWYSYNLERER